MGLCPPNPNSLSQNLGGTIHRVHNLVSPFMILHLGLGDLLNLQYVSPTEMKSVMAPSKVTWLVRRKVAWSMPCLNLTGSKSLEELLRSSESKHLVQTPTWWDKTRTCVQGLWVQSFLPSPIPCCFQTESINAFKGSLWKKKIIIIINKGSLC